MMLRRLGGATVSSTSRAWESPERGGRDRLPKMSADMTIGFVGLGAMGRHMAGRLLDAGHQLAVFDTRGEAIGTYVDLSTTGPVAAAEVAQALAESGIACLDAPVSGGVAGAQAGSLTIMAAGERGVFDRARPLLEALGRNVVHVGAEPGQGQLAKVLNNLLSATAIAITAEAVALGVRGGLSARTLLDVLNSSSGRNTASADKFPTQVLPRTFDAGFRMELMNKDVQLCLAEAQRQGVPMVLGGAVGQLWALAAATSREAADCTEIVRLVEDWAGVVVA